MIIVFLDISCMLLPSQLSNSAMPVPPVPPRLLPLTSTNAPAPRPWLGPPRHQPLRCWSPAVHHGQIPRPADLVRGLGSHGIPRTFDRNWTILWKAYRNIEVGCPYFSFWQSMLRVFLGFYQVHDPSVRWCGLSGLRRRKKQLQTSTETVRLSVESAFHLQRAQKHLPKAPIPP